MSVWESVESLSDFVYKTAHRDVLVRRREWFDRPEGLYQALWWVPAGHEPTPDEGLERLRHLKEHGPSSQAFTFAKVHPPPDTGKSKPA